MIYKKGNLRAEKIRYPDGIGCCIWIPISEEDDDVGLCWDFSFENIDNLIELLKTLKDVEPDSYVDD